ncbi:MAG: hypothetical protein HY898_17355 [Deltaproteobacteria bacterium]|nr:hypothetical protein [Deltaproteobacteria bacterium]
MRILQSLGGFTRLVVIGAVVASGSLSSDSAMAADDKQVCLGAYISAQRLRNEDKLVEAREQLLLCARDVCPATLKKDCTTWAAEVEQALPSVVIEARNSDGGDVIDVKVTVDGKPFTDRIDGKPKNINPGVHTFHYETEGAPAMDEKVAIRAGDKMRKLTVKFNNKGKSPPGAATASPDSSAAPDSSAGPSPTSTGDKVEGTRPVPAAVYALGGIGLVGFGVFTYFALKFDSQVSDLDACKPSCAQSKVDDASTTRTISYIPLGVGVVGVGVATILYLTRPTVDNKSEARGPRFDVKQISGGGLATFSTTF